VLHENKQYRDSTAVEEGSGVEAFIQMLAKRNVAPCRLSSSYAASPWWTATF
jgi:hypothetical protein